MKVPSATYRLQFHSGFKFTDAERVLGYLSELGISHLYASPLLKARHGSMHGYDVIDPATINPEIGSWEEFESFIAELHRNDLHLVLDIVPNHMAASVENPWWEDMLAHGEASQYARMFDVDWTYGKILLPILGRTYGECLEAGEFSIEGRPGDWRLRYFNHDLPLQVPAGVEARNTDELDRILSAQPYRLAYWRKAADAINYRRFFDINDLVGLRADQDDVFFATHSAVLDLVKRGWIDGLRIDHIDGLLDPERYLERLPPIYVVVEKILGGREALPGDWKAHGTTGYDFLNIVNGVFIDPAGFAALERIYADFTGRSLPQTDLFHQCKRMIMRQLFAGEVFALGNRLIELAERHRRARDLPARELRGALVAVTACLPVYRTYVRNFSITDADRQTIESAVRTAEAEASPDALKFVRQVLLLELPEYLHEHRNDYLDFVMRWQQFTGAVMAKALEDTTFYVHNPLIAVNEVGGDCEGPRVYFGVDEFHRRLADRRRTAPATMNATSTHDTKRSEDVRARIDVLSEMPEEWEQFLTRWRRWDCDEWSPDPNELVFIYQTLLGAWPVTQQRLHRYLIKALREAKEHTQWLAIDEAYERRVLDFVDRITNPHRSERFLQDLLRLQKTAGFFGAINSLGQTLIKVAAPGVADFYQGTELWNFRLADPDNREAVDFDERMKTLDWVRNHATLKELLRSWNDGRIKMFLIWKALNCRRNHSQLFADGEYVPVQAAGVRADHVIAFMRSHKHEKALIVVPRLASKITREGVFPLGENIWGETTIELSDTETGPWLNVLTGTAVSQPHTVSAVLSEFPVALLVRD